MIDGAWHGITNSRALNDLLEATMTKISRQSGGFGLVFLGT